MFSIVSETFWTPNHLDLPSSISAPSMRKTTLETEPLTGDIIRMDIQGYEFFALKGATRILQDAPNIIIFMEVDEVLQLYSNAYEEFSNLNNQGYKFWTIEKNYTIEPCTLSKIVALSEKGVRDILISKLDLLKEYPELVSK